MLFLNWLTSLGMSHWLLDKMSGKLKKGDFENIWHPNGSFEEVNK